MKKKIILSSDLLQKTVNLFDKLIGTIEPSLRSLILYHERNLKIRGSDGCLVADLIVVPKDLKIGKKAYVIPIDYLRHFLREKGQAIEIIMGEDLQFVYENESLIIKERERNIPGPFTPLSQSIEIEKGLLRSILDFGSSHLSQGDIVGLLIKEKELFCIGISDSIISCARMPFLLSNHAYLKIPYESIRHLVKSLELLKKRKVLCFLKKDGLAFEIGALSLQICAERWKDKKIEDICDFMFNHNVFSRWVLESSKLKSSISRASKIQKIGYSDSELILYPHKIVISVAQERCIFKTELDVLYSEKPKDIRIKLRVDKLYSLLSRINTQRIYMELTENGLLIKDKIRRAILIKNNFSLLPL